MNLNQRSHVFLSLFIDDKLKKGVKGLCDVEVEQVLDMILFKFLQEKVVEDLELKQDKSQMFLTEKYAKEDLMVKLMPRVPGSQTI